MDGPSVVVIFLLLGFVFFVGVIINYFQNRNSILSNRLLIALIIIGLVFLILGGLLIAALSIDAWFYSETTLIIGYSPFFLGLLMIIVGVVLRISRAK